MEMSEFESDNMKNSVIESTIPDCIKTEPCWLGIDEAGRGPVLGPMVYGICFSPLSLCEKFGEMGFADSKTLTEEEREGIFERICAASDMMAWIVELLSPTFISNGMLSRSKYNLNAISHDCAIRLVQRALELGANIAEVYVDTVGDPEKYQAKLRNLFPNIQITVAKKADSLYPIVSAASICAKVCRDRALSKWQFQEKITVHEDGYGSGYPGDPKTKRFLSDSMDKVFGFPQFVRFGWSTASVMLQKSAVDVQWDDDEEEEDKDAVKLTSFFQKKGHDPMLDRHSYFKDRCLTSCESF